MNQQKPQKSERLWTIVFVLIVLVSLCSFMVGQGLNAGTSVYLQRVGESVELAGSGALAFSIAAAVARIIAGPVIDTYGRRIVMIVGAIIMIFGTAGPLFENSGIPFIIWRILQGVGFSAAGTAASTAAADVLPKSRLGEGLGYFGLGQALSMSVGPALALFLISTDPASNFYIGVTICATFALIFSICIKYEKNPTNLPETSEYRIRFEKELVPITEAGASELDSTQNALSKNAQSISKEDTADIEKESFISRIFEPTALSGTFPMMFIATSFGFGIFFTALYGDSLGIVGTGIFFTVAALSMISIRLTSGKFMDKLPPIIIMGAAVIFGLIAFSIFLLCCLNQGIWSQGIIEMLYYITGIPYGLSLGIALPINQTVSVKLTPPNRWGAANALFLLGNDVAIGFASFIWGLLIGSAGYLITIICVMIMITISFFVALICYPKTNLRR